MKNIESTACVILNYNDADTTISLVKKIGDYKNIEHIIVVDNCSTDHSLEKLEKITDEKVVVADRHEMVDTALETTLVYSMQKSNMGQSTF